MKGDRNAQHRRRDRLERHRLCQDRGHQRRHHVRSTCRAMGVSTFGNGLSFETRSMRDRRLARSTACSMPSSRDHGEPYSSSAASRSHGYDFEHFSYRFFPDYRFEFLFIFHSVEPFLCRFPASCLSHTARSPARHHAGHSLGDVSADYVCVLRGLDARGAAIE